LSISTFSLFLIKVSAGNNNSITILSGKKIEFISNIHPYEIHVKYWEKEGKNFQRYSIRICKN